MISYAPDDEVRSLETLKHLAGEDWGVSIPDDYTLQIDLDDREEEVRFNLIFETLKESGRFIFSSASRHQSRSGQTHVIITLSRPLPVIERISWDLWLVDRKTEKLVAREADDLIRFDPEQHFLAWVVAR